MPHWIEAPDRPPFRCLLTVNADAASGPFYAPGIQFFEAIPSANGPLASRHPHSLYLSPDAFIEAAGVEGSPIVAMRREDYEAEQHAAALCSAERDDLAAQVEELRAQVSELEQHLNPRAFVEAAVEILDTRYAKRTGPKPKSAA